MRTGTRRLVNSRASAPVSSSGKAIAARRRAGDSDVPDTQHLVGGRVRGGPALDASDIGQQEQNTVRLVADSASVSSARHHLASATSPAG